MIGVCVTLRTSDTEGAVEKSPLFVYNRGVGKTKKGRTMTTKICPGCKRELEFTPDNFHRNKRNKNGLHHLCKVCRSKRRKIYYENLEPQKKWDMLARSSRWASKHREGHRISWHRTWARKKGYPATLTVDEYNETLEHFEHKCAVCGSSEKLEMDHWIPYNETTCPGTVAHNCVPLCFDCNQSKHTTLPGMWLLTTQGIERGASILLKVNTYLKGRR